MCSYFVVCIGELLIDFFCIDVDVDLMEGCYFLKSVGGVLVNVLVVIVKLGG